MAENDAGERKKRRVRNPETIRERAIKAQEEAAKPGRSEVLRKRTGAVTSRPAKFLVKIFSVPPLRWLAKLVRFIGRFIVPKYFRSSWRELRLVTWPDRTKTRQLTFAVLIFAVAFGALVSVVDYGLDKLFREVLLK